MMPSQIEDVIQETIRLFDEVYATFGLTYHAELSTRPDNSMGDDATWEMTTDALRKAMDDFGLDYSINEGDGAFYGPKIDFHLKDSIGRTWQCGTIQLDMLLPEKFNLTYTGEDGQKHRPVMIHRVVYGSIERFIGILTENYAGAFPTWLAPVQIKILPISENTWLTARTSPRRWKPKASASKSTKAMKNWVTRSVRHRWKKFLTWPSSAIRKWKTVPSACATARKVI